MTLLDTNIVIHALRGNEKVVRRFEERAGSLALPAMVLGELLYGVARSGNPAKNGELLESLVGTLPIIHTDNEIMQNGSGNARQSNTNPPPSGPKSDGRPCL